MLDLFPRIEVTFGIEGKNLNINKLTEEIGILPTSTRGIDDWPDAIKNNPDIPEELQPRCEWCLCQEMDMCKQIEVPINKIIARIKGKETKILEFCEIYGLEKYLSIVIHAKEAYLPELVLSSEIISYFGKLETEISFDMYVY